MQELAGLGLRLLEATSLREALGQLALRPNVVVAGLHAPDCVAMFHRAARIEPRPLLVAIACAGLQSFPPSDVFELGGLGVDALLGAPLASGQLGETVRERLCSRATEYERLLRRSAGANERRILDYLLAHRNIFVRPERVAREVLERGDPAGQNLVWQYVFRLRKALHDPSALSHVRGKGYRLRVPP